MVNIERVDNRLFWNVKVGDECVGWIKVENYKLVFNQAINSFAPELSFTQRCDAIIKARRELSHEEILGIECGGDIDLRDTIAEFLNETGMEESECNEQAIALIKSLKKKWNIKRYTE